MNKPISTFQKTAPKFPAWVLFFSLILSFLVYIPIWILWILLFRPMKRLSNPVGIWFRLFFWLTRTKVRLHGIENKQAHAIYLLNHQSALDIGLAIGWLAPVVFLAKHELFRIPFFGKAMKVARCIPVYRNNLTKNTQIGTQLVQNLLDGFNYVVFPEGTRSRDGSLLPFKRGLFKILFQNSISCSPVTIVHAHKVLARKAFWFQPGTIDLYLHPQVSPSSFQDAKAFQEQVHQTISQSLS